MARKRRTVNDATQRLLASKLSLLQEGAQPQRHAGAAALDLLTGRSGSQTQSSGAVPSSEDAAGGGAARIRGKKHGDGNAARTADDSAETVTMKGARQRVRARTVYLSDAEIRRIDEIGRAWEGRLNRRVSRSEVFRQALESFQESAAAPGVPEEESDSHA